MSKGYIKESSKDVDRKHIRSITGTASHLQVTHTLLKIWIR